jgi:tetratricopeptide (TPR) repeat protein
MSVCSFFTACYYAADFERAGSWVGVLRRRGLISLEPGAPVFLSSHCDSVQATLLVELGRWSEAEAVLVRAKAAFESAMQMPSWHPDIALADLRIKQGRLSEAEALLVGKDQSVQALLPAARLHLARGDHELAQAVARRGLRVVGGDRLRAVELLTTLIDAELAAGDVDGAVRSSRALAERAADLDVAALRARGAAACARAMTASGAIEEAIGELERAVDGIDGGKLPWLCATLHLELARRRDELGDRSGAAAHARSAAAILPTLDVVMSPEDTVLLDRLDVGRFAVARSQAVLARGTAWWTASCGGTTARMRNSKGLCYLAELLNGPGSEYHVLDLADRIEGIALRGGPDRRALGDAGEILDSRARTDYRRRIEALRAEVDEALAADMFDTAEAVQAELDQLVGQLAAAFGLGGRTRRAASAVERARLNVTRAIRSAIANLEEALPEARATLGPRVRTGVYCAYEPDGDEVTWVFRSE